MRRDKTLLIIGATAGAVLAAGTYISGFGWVAALGILLTSVLLTRVVTFAYFERFLAFKYFDDFKSERVRHECQACGACCHLRVNLGADDVDRILEYSKQNGIDKIVMENRSNRYWLKRDSGRCFFLNCSGDTPRCGIYSIRPVACRLYPLIPMGNRLKSDPLCPGFNKSKGRTFKEYLRAEQVGAYVRRFIGKV